MNYLVKKVLQKVSFIAIVAHLHQKEKVRILNVWWNIHGTDEESYRDFVSGKTKQFTREDKENIKDYINRKFNNEISNKYIENILVRDGRNYTVQEIEEYRVREKIRIKDLCDLLSTKTSRYYHWKKNGMPIGISELLYTAIEVLSKEKEKVSKLDLIALRINTGKSMEETSMKLGMTADEYFETEWKNSVPLNKIEDFSRYYNINQADVPALQDKSQYHRSILKATRKAYNISLKEITENSGIKTGKCIRIENDNEKAPSYEYIRYIASRAGKTPEELLTEKRVKKLIHVPYDTVEYYRKLYYKRSLTGEKSRHAFQMDCGITNKKYTMEKWTIPQIERAVKLLGLEDCKPLTVELGETEKRINEMKIDPNKLRLSRIEAKLSMGMAAFLINRSKTIICMMEKGKYKCTPDILRDLSKIYKKQMEYFVLDA